MQMFDVIVIGAGSGGLAFAKEASKYKKQVAIIDKDKIGGTCVNYGCIPKKLLYNMASLLIKDIEYLKTSQKLDFKKFIEMRDEYIKKLNEIYYKQLNNLDIHFIKGEAILEDGNVVKVNNQIFKAKHILLATGSSPKMLNIEGKEFLKSSNDFFNLKTPPKSSIIIGSGYIAIETAFLLKKLGSKVSIIMRNDKFLSHYDEMIGESIKEYLKNEGIEFFMKAETKRVVKNGDFYDVTIIQNQERIISGEFIMCAIGRDCNTNYIKFDINHSDGYLKVNGNFETSVKNVYAIGDLIGPKHMLTPVAIFCGRKLAQNLYSKIKTEKENLTDMTTITEKYRIYEFIPTVVFSHPPCASVGLSEIEARKYKNKIKIYESEFVNLFYSLQNQKPKTRIKVITADNKVVGLHIVGHGADEMIQGFAVALKKGITYEDLINTICVHPTASEEVLLVKEKL